MAEDSDQTRRHQLLFFDHNQELLEQYQTIVGERRFGEFETHFVTDDVKEIVDQYRVNIIVSPANCLGFMDGGIDIVYMQMFPGIQTRVQDRIKTFDITTALGRYVLPIGSAMLVATGSQQCPLLACVPTMFLPERVSDTRNVYWAMRALLRLLSQYAAPMVVAIPCLGTGVGRLTGQESAQQVIEALHDHMTGSTAIAQLEDVELWRNENSELPLHATVLTGMACPQPPNYANTEIQPDDTREIQARRD